MYADNDQKFIAILNPKIPIPQLMNGLGHMTTGLMALATDSNQMNFQEYQFNSDRLTPAKISLYPFIILKSKNSNQLKTLHETVSDLGILHNVFANSMLGASAIEQLEATKSTKSEDLIYFGITLFGDSQKLAELTRKFSLFSV
jgi:Protein of unknown function (DUF2000)